MRPLLMTGALVQWLRQHFSAGTNLEDPDLNQTGTEFVWRSDRQTRQLTIESYTRWDADLVENRPALIVKRNAWRHQRTGIENRLLGTRPDAPMEFTNLWLGSHTVFVITGEGAECEKLATEVYRELNQFGPVVLRALALARFEVSEIGALSLLEEASENFVVPITVTYACFENWQLQSSAAPLRGVQVQWNLS